MHGLYLYLYLSLSEPVSNMFMRFVYTAADSTKRLRHDT
jgi:hypothetical protein